MSLGICGLLGITCVTASMGVLFGIFCFHLFSSVIGHPLLVERQWAVTDDIRNEPQCHPPPSPLPFNELCVPWAGLLSQESTAAPALALRLQLCPGGLGPLTQEGLLLLLSTDKII